MKIGPYRFVLGGGRVHEVMAAQIRDTGIEAEYGMIPGAGGTLVPAFSLPMKHMKRATEEFKRSFPNARITYVAGEDILGGRMSVIGGLSTSAVFLVVNDTVAVHPLSVRIRAYVDTVGTGENGVSALAEEMKQFPGLLGEILP